MPYIPNIRAFVIKPIKQPQARSHKVKDYDTKEWREYSLELRTSIGKCTISNREYLPKYLIVDHIIPVNQGGSFWDKRNHQVISIYSHSKKTRRETVEGCKTPWILNEEGDKIPKQWYNALTVSMKQYKDIIIVIVLSTAFVLLMIWSRNNELQRRSKAVKEHVIEVTYYDRTKDTITIMIESIDQLQIKHEDIGFLVDTPVNSCLQLTYINAVPYVCNVKFFKLLNIKQWQSVY